MQRQETDIRPTFSMALRRCTLLAVIVFFIAGCSATKYLKEDQSFYGGATIKINAHGNVPRQKNVKSKLQEFLEVTPNTIFLGSRPLVWIYFNAGNPKKKGGIGNWIKKNFGREPVLLKNAQPAQTARTLNAELNNIGFFDATVTMNVATKNKVSKVTYTADLYQPFRLKNINYSAIKDTGYAATFKSLRSESLLKPGQRFSVARLQQEQARIEEVMHNLGFYYFNKHYVLFKADTTAGDRQVDIDLTFEPSMPEKARRVYTLDKIKVYPDYSFSDTTVHTRDTIDVNGYTYIDNRKFFRPIIITNTINLRPGKIYSQTDRDLTQAHLTTLGAFKFVNLKFSDSNKDSASLDATVLLTPRLKKNIRMETQFSSKSNNFVGPGVGFTFTNRNFLRGAELFQFKVNAGYETQISRQQSGTLSSLDLGFESSLSVPRFITPIKIRYTSQRYLPQTIFKVGYVLQKRLGYFQLNSFTAAYGYSFRESTSKTHTLYPITIDYVEVTNKSQAFSDLVDPIPALKRAFENQFIPGGRYSFTYNSQLTEDHTNIFKETRKPKSSIYFNGNVELGGNLLHAFQKVVTPKEEGQRTLLGSPYAQYARADIDFRYYRQLNVHSRLASRFIAGLGLPYGNSSILPYIKQFSIGGANSIRAFPARSLGPGSYNVRDDASIKTKTYFIDQRGDIKLEGNVEYRFDIISVVKGALFLDAGNIWLLKSDSAQSKVFHSNTFIDQLAVGTGFGVRVDLNFFVIRLDLGIPLRKPYLPENERWVIDKINFASGPWRSENLLLNISIGYPF